MPNKSFVVQPKGADYYRKREAEERAAAELATNLKARAAHEDMAAAYRQLAGDPAEPETAAPEREAVEPQPGEPARAA